MKSITTFCTPAKVYLILAATGFIASLFNKIGVVQLLSSIILIPLWTLLLNWLCSKGFSVLSWFLVILKYFVFFALMSLYLTILM
jgi:hypothetical protein